MIMAAVMIMIVFLAFNAALVWAVLKLRKYVRTQTWIVAFLFYCVAAVLFVAGNYAIASVFINLLR